MRIKRIIREEIKNSTEEDWEWTEGNIDLKHILDIILEGSNFLILTAEEEADFWGHDVTPGYEDLIFLYEKDEMSEGHYIIFERSQTLEEVLEWVYNIITLNNSGRPQVVIDEFILLYDVIKNRAEKLFNVHAKSLYEEIIREEIDGFKDSTEEDWEWAEGINSDLPNVPEELENILRFDEYSGFRNRVIVNFEDSDLSSDWYEYNEWHSQGEWDDMTYTDNKDEQVRIVFDQDVIPHSQNSKVCKTWKKWLIKMGFKVKEVYLGEL